MTTLKSCGKNIFYEHTEGKTHTNVFHINGHKGAYTTSDRAPALKQMALENDYGFVGFDPAGYGKSEGAPEEWKLEEWLQNALDVLDAIPSNNNFLFGSSMGGYLMIAVALLRPEKVKGLIGISAGFGASFYKKRGDKPFIEDVANKIRINIKQNTEPFYNYIDEQLDIDVPILLHASMADDVVSYMSSVQLMKKIKSPNMRISMAKSAEHCELSQSDMEEIFRFIKESSKQAQELFQ